MAAPILIEASVLGTSLVMVLVHSPGTRRNKTGAQPHWLYPPANLLHSPEALFLRDVLSGMLWCSAAAAFSCILLIDSPFKPETPLLFLAVLLVIATRFGSAAGSLGTLMAALIFSEFLLEPLQKLTIDNPIARRDLG